MQCILARIYSKPQVQEMLKALRHVTLPNGQAAFSVKRLDAGYEVKHVPSGRIVFIAMIGRRAYLVKHADNLFALTIYSETKSQQN